MNPCLTRVKRKQVLDFVIAIGEIVGKTTTEDLLDSIFSQFCIGK
jgi:tRNA U34 5-carboxymethylaminomethyl modifying GTPase MnmE/TrmE